MQDLNYGHVHGLLRVEELVLSVSVSVSVEVRTSVELHRQPGRHIRFAPQVALNFIIVPPNAAYPSHRTLLLKVACP